MAAKVRLPCLLTDDYSSLLVSVNRLTDDYSRLDSLMTIVLVSVRLTDDYSTTR